MHWSLLGRLLGRLLCLNYLLRHLFPLKLSFFGILGEVVLGSLLRHILGFPSLSCLPGIPGILGLPGFPGILSLLRLPSHFSVPSFLLFSVACLIALFAVPRILFDVPVFFNIAVKVIVATMLAPTVVVVLIVVVFVIAAIVFFAGVLVLPGVPGLPVLFLAIARLLLLSGDPAVSLLGLLPQHNDVDMVLEDRLAVAEVLVLFEEHGHREEGGPAVGLLEHIELGLGESLPSVFKLLL